MKNPIVRLFARPFALTLAVLVPIAAAVALLTAHAAFAQAALAHAPIVLTGADRRPATSLDGDWASIVDPYFSGLFSFHHQEKANGWFLNRKAQPSDNFPTEYDFGKAPTLKVPSDWNTQRESLIYYEGPVWYERDFTYQPKEHTRIFLHVGAANYRSWFWVNGREGLRARGRIHELQLRRDGGDPRGRELCGGGRGQHAPRGQCSHAANRLVELWRPDIAPSR